MVQVAVDPSKKVTAEGGANATLGGGGNKYTLNVNCQSNFYLAQHAVTHSTDTSVSERLVGGQNGILGSLATGVAVDFSDVSLADGVTVQAQCCIKDEFECDFEAFKLSFNSTVSDNLYNQVFDFAHSGVIDGISFVNYREKCPVK